MLRTSTSTSSTLFNRERTPKTYAKDSTGIRDGSSNLSKTRLSGNSSNSSNGSDGRRDGGASSTIHSGRRIPPRSFHSVPSSEPQTTRAVGHELPVHQIRELPLPQPAKWRLGQDRPTWSQTEQNSGTDTPGLRGSWVNIHENDSSSPTNQLDIASAVKQDKQGKQTTHQEERRRSVGTNMSVGHYKHLDQTANMRLLSDETPPDEMDASWGLDISEEDAEMEQQQQEGKSQPLLAEGTRTKLSQFSPKSQFRNPHTATSGKHHPITTHSIESVHGYGNMDYDEQPDTLTTTRRGISTTLSTVAASQQPAQHDDYDPAQNDIQGSNGSFASSHLKQVSALSSQQQQSSTKASKFPWRDSKLDNIFMDLLANESSAPPMRQLSPGPTKQQRAPSPFDPGHTDASASLSFGEIMDALNNVEDSMDAQSKPTKSRQGDANQTTRQRKFEKARERLARLSPPVQDLPRSSDSTPQPAKPASASRVSATGASEGDEDDNDAEALEKQRAILIKAAMTMDINDDRSVAPDSSAKSRREDDLARRKLTLRHHGRRTDRDRTSFGARQPSQETDRTSTTSRDSLYRDSISGSTLGPISAGPSDNGLAKAEAAAQELLALKVDALFQDSSRDIEARRSSILPLLLNTKSTETALSKDIIDTADIQQPRIFAQSRHTSLQSDKAKQYLAMASKRLEKQASSIVEQLANGTDTALRSAVYDKPSPAIAASKGDDNHDNDDIEEDELRLSNGVEEAFKCLEDVDLDLSMDVKLEKTKLVQRRQSTDDYDDNLLSRVMLPSVPKRKGEYSLRWEDQQGHENKDDEDDNEASAGRHISKRTSELVGHTAVADIGDTSTDTVLMPEEASFSHAKGHLMAYLSSIYPWDPWDQVKTLDLSKRGVESTITMNECLPKLETLNLNENQVAYLTGVPKSVRTLLAKSNQLSDLTNFAHLVNLQYLDISNNHIEDLTSLSVLSHLRELIAVGNRIKSVEALQHMDGLIRLDVSRNCLQSIDFQRSKLQRLEYLNASHNQIEQLDNLESLVGLIHVNLGHNLIEHVSLVQPLKRLRILNLTQNRLVQFDSKPFPNLKTLYLDDNRLEVLQNCASLTRLENFSVRDQEGDGTPIVMTEFLNSRKLYLSGNPVHSLRLSEGFYQLEYLEICAGCLSELPPDFASLMPNLRGLNLSYNELDSLASLEGLHRLRRLIFVGNNLKRFNSVLDLVKRLRSLVSLDLRHNPLTSNMYPVMSIRQGASPYQDTYRTGQTSATKADWRRRDAAFRRALPDSMCYKRLVYRAAIIKVCKKLKWFDGATIQDKERQRVPYVLNEMLDGAGHILMRRDDDEDDDEDDDNEDEDDKFEYDDAYGEHDLEMMMAAAPDHGELPPRLKPFVLADRRSILSGATTRSSNLTTSSQSHRDSRQSPDLRHHSRWMAHVHSLPRTPSDGGAAAGGGGVVGVRGAESPSPRGDLATLRPRQAGSAFQSALANGSSHQSAHHKRAPSFAPLIVEGGTHAQAPQQRKQVDEQNGRYDASSVKSDGSYRRSAVKSWRDEVNEASQRRVTMTPTPRSSSSASRASSARQAPQHQRQQQQSQSQPSSGVPSARNSRLPPPRASTGPPPTTLTLAIHQKLASSPRTSYQTHGRRRSDGALHQHHFHVSAGGRGATGTGAGGSSPRNDTSRMSPMSPRHMSQSAQLSRPTHLRRRSFGFYHPHGGYSRHREMTGEHHLYHHGSPMVASPQDYFMSLSMPAGGFETPGGGATASPSYFSLNHHHSNGHGHQTPYGGMSRSLHSAMGTSGRSMPNTPNRTNAAANGRLSQQEYPIHTLARAMERNDE
ncbi:hypothetical protein BGW42_005008 [Actinomortierella wolfii]|nr:hypothetical protein BGW42_005008 [Actinomortierella wolfii]